MHPGIVAGIYAWHSVPSRSSLQHVADLAHHPPRVPQLPGADNATSDGPPEGGERTNRMAKVREKNRNAQRRFREKQRQNYQELLKHCASLEASVKQLQAENGAMR